MSKLEKSFVVAQVDRVVEWQREYRWLAELGVTASNIAHFSCGTGESTLGLMWAVDSIHAVGLDMDSKRLQEGRDRLSQLQWEMDAIWKRLRVSESLPIQEFMWWNDDVPDFLKHNLLEEIFSLTFVRGSVFPSENQLEHEAYDLAFCDNVLHQIWWDRSRADAEEDTRNAIGSMMRIVRPGGYLACFEWVEQRFRPKLDFRRLFEQMQLDVVFAQEIRLDNWRGRGQAAGFLCQKRAI